MPQRSGPLVRRAQPADAEVLATLGRALNVQQGDPSMNFTAEAVRRDGFGEAPKFEAWVAEVNGQIVGYTLVVPAAYETGYAKAGVYVQDVFVAPERGTMESDVRSWRQSLPTRAGGGSSSCGGHRARGTRGHMRSSGPLPPWKSQ